MSALHICFAKTTVWLLRHLARHLPRACTRFKCRLLSYSVQVDPADVVVVEGILVLHVPELREQLNMKIYVDTGEGQPSTRGSKGLAGHSCAVSKAQPTLLHACPTLAQHKADVLA